MRESRRDRRPRSVAARVGQDSGRAAPCVQPNTPGGHQRENVRSARQLSPRRVQFSVAKSVQFSVAIDSDQRNLVVGVEHWFGGWLGIRGGARFNLEDDDPQIVGAFGLSLALTPGMYLDGQVTRGRESVERGWGIAGRVGF